MQRKNSRKARRGWSETAGRRGGSGAGGKGLAAGPGPPPCPLQPSLAWQTDPARPGPEDCAPAPPLRTDHLPRSSSSA